MRQIEKLGFLTLVLALTSGAGGCGSDKFTSADQPAPGDGGGLGGSGMTDAAADSSAGTGGSSGSGGAAGSTGDGGSTSTGGGGGSAGTSASGGGAGAGGASGSAGSGVGGSNSGGSGGSSGAPGSGGTGGGVEDCLNGLDDDNNGMADCADPACQTGYTCVPPAPAGWIGIGWIDPQLGACPAELPSALDLFEKSGLSAPPASCTCDCGSPTGVQCGTHAGCWSSSNECNNGTPNKGTTTQCAANVPTIANGSAWCKAGPPGAWGGSCAPDSTSATEPWTWPAAARACLRAEGGICAGSTQVCVPKLSGSTGKACVVKLGDIDCPPLFTNKSLYYDGTATDQRSCDGTGCSCEAPTGATCGCSGAGCQVQLYGIVACGGTATSFVSDGTCKQVQASAVVASKLANTIVDEPGSCSPAGSATPTGAVTPTNLITVCCVP